MLQSTHLSLCSRKILPLFRGNVTLKFLTVNREILVSFFLFLQYCFVSYLFCPMANQSQNQSQNERKAETDTGKKKEDTQKCLSNYPDKTNKNCCDKKLTHV